MDPREGGLCTIRNNADIRDMLTVVSPKLLLPRWDRGGFTAFERRVLLGLMHWYRVKLCRWCPDYKDGDQFVRIGEEKNWYCPTCFQQQQHMRRPEMIRRRKCLWEAYINDVLTGKVRLVRISHPSEPNPAPTAPSTFSDNESTAPSTFSDNESSDKSIARDRSPVSAVDAVDGSLTNAPAATEAEFGCERLRIDTTSAKQASVTDETTEVKVDAAAPKRRRGSRGSGGGNGGRGTNKRVKRGRAALNAKAPVVQTNADHPTCPVCLGDEGGTMLLCDGKGCNGGYHVQCLGVKEIPPGEWYCPCCLTKVDREQQIMALKYDMEKRAETLLGRKPRPDHWIRSDGNCLFDSLADQVMHDSQVASAMRVCGKPWLQGGREQVSSYIRQGIVRWLRQNAYFQMAGQPLRAWMQGFPTWPAFCDDLAKDKAWGDHLSLVAAAHWLKRPVAVLLSKPVGKDDYMQVFHPQTPLQSEENDSHQPTNTPPLVICHYDESVYGHYNSLQPLSS